MTPEERALGVMLAFPVRNTEGQAEAMQRYIAEQFADAIAEEREACARVADQYGGNAAEYIAILIRRRGVPAEGGRP